MTIHSERFSYFPRSTIDILQKWSKQRSAKMSVALLNFLFRSLNLAMNGHPQHRRLPPGRRVSVRIQVATSIFSIRAIRSSLVKLITMTWRVFTRGYVGLVHATQALHWQHCRLVHVRYESKSWLDRESNVRDWFDKVEKKSFFVSQWFISAFDRLPTL